jgi:hypothetical protein
MPTALPPVPAAFPTAAYASPFEGQHYTTGSIDRRPVVRLHRRHHDHYSKWWREHHRHHPVTAEVQGVFSHTMFYAVLDGKILHRGKVIAANIQSGRGRGLNNPEFETVSNEGAAPRQTYSLGKPFSAPPRNEKGRLIQGMGINRIAIAPVKGSPIEYRKFLEIHSREGRNTGSHGCITTPNQAAQDYLVSYMQRNRITRLTIVSSIKDIPALESRMQIAEAKPAALVKPLPGSDNLSFFASQPAEASSAIHLQPSPVSALNPFRSSFYTVNNPTFRYNFSLAPSP